MLPSDAGIHKVSSSGELVAWFQITSALGQIQESPKGTVIFGVDFHLDGMTVVCLFGVGGDGCGKRLALTEKALGRCADQLLIAHAPQEPNAPTDRHQEQFPSGASMKDQGQGRRWDGQGGQQELQGSGESVGGEGDGRAKGQERPEQRPHSFLSLNPNR